MCQPLKQFTQFEEQLFRGIDMNEYFKLYHTNDETYKGIIYDHNHKLVACNFPVPEEVVLTPETAQNISYPVHVYKGVEGTLIRVFYYNDEWHIATSSRLDAYTSFWANHQSFGRQFEEYVESITGTPFDVFLMSLDTSLIYFFILPTQGANRLGKVEDELEKHIYLVGIQAEGKLELPDSKRLEKNAWSYLESYVIQNAQDLLDQSEQTPLIYYHLNDQSNEFKIIKYISELYALRCKLRNNCQNVPERYFELLKQDPTQATQFRSMYPESNLEFYSKQLSYVVGYIHKNYYDRYVKKEHVVIPKIYFQIMKKCHERFLETHEKTTPTVVYHIILEQDVKLILSLIRNFSN
jgi:hypothetical protein